MDDLNCLVDQLHAHGETLAAKRIGSGSLENGVAPPFGAGPVPQGGQPGDTEAPVQPFPTYYPLFAGMPGLQPEVLERVGPWQPKSRSCQKRQEPAAEVRQALETSDYPAGSDRNPHSNRRPSCSTAAKTERDG